MSKLLSGEYQKLDKSLKDKILNAQKKTLNNKSISLVIAFDYGGRNEIVNTVKVIKDNIKLVKLMKNYCNYINKIQFRTQT